MIRFFKALWRVRTEVEWEWRHQSYYPSKERTTRLMLAIGRHYPDSWHTWLWYRWLFEWRHSWDDYGKHFFRLILWRFLHLVLFTKYCNYLQGQGWEIDVELFHGWIDFSFGCSSERGEHSIGPNPHIIKRWRGWAYCDHHSEYEFPEMEER